MFGFPKIAEAAFPQNVKDLITRIEIQILNPIIILMFAAALAVFLWGALEFIAQGNDPGKRKQGSNHMIFGVIGMFVMVSVFGIMKLLAGTLGASTQGIP